MILQADTFLVQVCVQVQQNCEAFLLIPVAEQATLQETLEG
jgi:hypothetical protein